MTFSVTVLCQFSFIQADFNPTLVAMSGNKGKVKKEAKTPPKNLNKTYKKIISKGKKKKSPFVENKTLKKIYGRQARRSKVIDAFKKKGALGESDSGLLKVRTSKGLSKKEKEIMNKFVKAENKDRKRIIAEIEKGGFYTERQKKEIRQTMFKFNRTSDSKGTYFFQADNWQKKE